MTGYAIPTIKSFQQLQTQLNRLLGGIGEVIDLLTAAYVADELSVPLLTETGVALDLDP